MMKKLLALGLTFMMSLSVVAMPGITAHAANNITLDQAKSIALDNAGYTEKEVTLVKAKTEPPVKTGKVTKESAIAIALSDAGYSEKDVTLLHAKKDYDDGKDIFEVEFKVGHIEYNYDIDIATGEIIDFDIDD